MMLSVFKLCYVYRSPYFPAHLALSDLSFEIPSGEITAIVGASGSGKTTLVQHLNGLLKPTSGSVRVGDWDTADSRTNVKVLRRKVGLVFQFPESQLFEETVEKDVAFGLKPLKVSKAATRRRTARAMAVVGLDWGRFAKASPFHLSEGEKRRAAIAGVLVTEPDVLILDEPTAGLDWNGMRQVEAVMGAYHRSGRTVLFVSHDMDLVGRLAERVLVLDKGRLVFDGKKETLFRQAGLLKQAGLTLPHTVRFMQMLKHRGMPVRTDLFTVEEAKNEIRRVLRRNPKYRRCYKFEG
ncbi:MAG TPA: ATP-binding cassette domain-containing protein [bacterium]